MADKKISELTALLGADTTGADVLPIVDTSALTTKKISMTDLSIGLKNAVTVDTIAEIEALTPSNTSGSVILTHATRGGTFTWDSSNRSSEVTADTQQGIWIAPSSDATGASGAWHRQYDGAVNVKWFGAVGDGVTDDTSAIQAALDSEFQNIYLPEGTYNITNLRYESTDTLVFTGSGNNTILNITGDDADAESYTLGTTTITASLLFATGGVSKHKIGWFKIIGNSNISYAIAFARYQKGSRFSNIDIVDCDKTAAVACTFLNCLTSVVDQMTTNNCSRAVRIMGGCDALEFNDLVVYTVDQTYSQVFNEVAYFSATETARYAQGVIFNSPYGYGGTVDSGTFIEFQESQGFCIRQMWTENFTYSLEITNCDSVYVQASRNSAHICEINVVSCTGGFYDIDIPITLDPGSQLNVVRCSRAISQVTDNTTLQNNIVITNDQLYTGVGILFDRSGTPLDYYEENTWSSAVTAVVNCSSLTLSNATYTRIGRVITVHGRISGTATATATATSAKFTLPYQMKDYVYAAVGSAVHTLSTYGLGVIKDATGSNGTEAALVIPASMVTSSGAFTADFTFTYETL